MTRIILVLIAGFLLLSGQSASADYQQRQQFLELEKQISRGGSGDIRYQLAQMQGYPLHAYLWYLWLKKNLHMTAEITSFQQQYSDSRYAKLLRTKQMTYFIQRQYWQSAANNYRESDGETQQCQYYWALYHTGEKHTALQGAAELWAKGHSLPKACDALLKQFVASSHFTSSVNWQRFEAALSNRKVGLAKYLIRFFNRQDKRIAEQWLNVHNNPSRVSSCHSWNYSMPQSAGIFSHGVRRLARRDLDGAIDTWDSRKNSFNFSQQQLQTVEQDLAIRLVKNRNYQANLRFKTLNFNTAELQPWRVKAALLAQDWQQVSAAVDLLSPELQQQDIWQYWRARAHFQLGETEQGSHIFKTLAEHRSFYGFVAADYFGQSYQLDDRPIIPDPTITRRLLDSVSLKAAQEFLYLGRDKMARREWWFAISDLDNEEYKAAAKIAQQWGLPLLAISTVARAKYWDDVELRFPMAYQNQINSYARLRGLDPAIVYGLIRRESAFDVNAQSPVGARGLMQIMPQTGRTIARDLNERWQSKYVLLNADTNIRYGTFYFKQLLDRFDGQYALAAAGYNAGPHRVKRWRPKNRSLPADIWIELIPFTETRKYVTAVLEYALVYQTKLQSQSLKMSAFLPDVMPGYGEIADNRSSKRACS